MAFNQKRDYFLCFQILNFFISIVKFKINGVKKQKKATRDEMFTI